MRDLELFHQLPLAPQVRIDRAAVEGDRRRARQQRRDRQVPDDPAGRAEPEESVAGAEVSLQSEPFVVFEQRAAVRVRDRLRQRRRSGREQDVQRVVERYRGELQVAVGPEDVRPPHGAGWHRVGQHRVGQHGAVRQVGQPHQRLHAGQGCADRLHFGEPGEVLSAEAVPVHGEQHLRVHLPEPVDDAVDPELWRAHGPYRADAGCRQESGNRLGDVRQVGADDVPSPDAELEQPGSDPPGLPAQVFIAPGDIVAHLGDAGDNRSRRQRPEDMLRKVQRGAGEPCRIRDSPRGEDLARRVGEPHPAEFRHLRVEIFQVLDRPRLEIVVGRQRLAVPSSHLRHETAHLRRLTSVRCGSPQDVTVHGGSFRRESIVLRVYICTDRQKSQRFWPPVAYPATSRHGHLSEGRLTVSTGRRTRPASVTRSEFARPVHARFLMRAAALRSRPAAVRRAAPGQRRSGCAGPRSRWCRSSRAFAPPRSRRSR